MSAPITTQLAASFGLWWKQLRRRSMRAGEAPSAKGGIATLALMTFVTLYMLPFGWHIGEQIAEMSRHQASARRLVLWVALAGTMSMSVLAYSPRIGRVKTLWRSTFLDLLPVSPFVRAIMVWLQSTNILLFSIPILVAAQAGDRLARAPAIVGIVVCASIIGSLLGQALVVVLRSVAPRVYFRISTIAIVLAIAPLLVLVNVSRLATRLSEASHDPLLVPARWLGGQGGGALSVLGALVAMSLAALLLAIAERMPRDAHDDPPQGRYEGSRIVSPVRAELRMLWRQGSIKALYIQLVLMILFAVTLLVGARGPLHDPDLVVLLTRGVFAQGTLLMSAMLFAASGVVTTRDLEARPFLSALPMTPASVLARVTSAFRWLLVPWLVAFGGVAAAILVLGPPLPRHAVIDLVARVVMLLIATRLLCSIVPAVSFLTRGLGAMSVGGAALPSPVVSILVLMPILAIVMSPHLLQSVVALLTFAALTREATRAAQRCLSWLDDGGEGERDTPVWRALLVLGGFFATQSLVAGGLGLAHLSPALQGAIVYAASALVLAVLSLMARPRPVVRSRSLGWDALGLVGGLASGGAALLFLQGLERLGVSLPADAAATGASVYALGVAVVIIAPLCEELFFRGWLQAAIESELGRRARWAPVLGALAFAAAHLGTFFVPQLVLGIVAGLLFQRTGRLRPGILAHVAHNALTTLLAR